MVMSVWPIASGPGEFAGGWSGTACPPTTLFGCGVATEIEGADVGPCGSLRLVLVAGLGALALLGHNNVSCCPDAFALYLQRMAFILEAGRSELIERRCVE